MILQILLWKQECTDNLIVAVVLGLVMYGIAKVVDKLRE